MNSVIDIDDFDKDTNSIESIEKRYNSLKARLDKLKDSKNKIDTVVQMKKKQRDELIDKIKSMGYDPDKIEDQIKEKKRILMLKLDNIEKEIKILEDKIAPMLEAIK